MGNNHGTGDLISAQIPDELDAESAVIASVMLRPDALDVISIKAGDFADIRNQVIFEAMQGLYVAGKPVDPVTLAEQLEATGRLNIAGGPDHLMTVLESECTPVHVRYYASAVSRMARVRAITELCRHLVDVGQSPGADPAAMLAQLEATTLACRVDDVGGSESCTLADAVSALEAQEAKPATIHPTGLGALDKQLGGGLRDGQLMVIGGRPGGGKSVLAVQIAMAFVRRQEAALLISLEMSRAEIAYRLAKANDRADLRRLPLHIVDKPLDVDKIEALARLGKRSYRMSGLVVDYLQLVIPRDKRAVREQQVADMSRSLKRLAMELEVPVIAACQLNRNTERDGRAPRLSDLRESGAIEQDADIVTLIHQGDNSESLIVAKNRNGSPGHVPCNFQRPKFQFADEPVWKGV